MFFVQLSQVQVMKIRNLSLIHIISVSGMTALLVACGGGGDDGSSTGTLNLGLTDASFAVD